MATLSVLKFPTADGAQQVEATLSDLQKQRLIQVQDAALVTWPPGTKKPQTVQLHRLAGQAVLAGAFWDALFGLIFFRHCWGVADGVDVDVLCEEFCDYGIDDAFIQQTRVHVTEGTSALFVLTSGVLLDKMVAALQGRPFENISAILPKEKEDKLRAVFNPE